MSEERLKAAKIKKLELLERKRKRESELPHLYGFPWYEWAWSFFTTKNKMALLTAGNQLSKSTTQIRKVIHLATAVEEWPEWWATRPKQFWYLYPSKDVATVEFYEKWVPEVLPRGSMVDDPQYGWKADFDQAKKIRAIFFNSGVSIYFKSYEQSSENLQTGTVHYIATDEELPNQIYDELKFRTAATDGYFSMVFTATLGQEMWRLAMEPNEGEKEMFPNAWKRTVSAYDCLFYKDGKPSPWTVERIKAIEESCKSQAEINKRVHGKFIRSSDFSFPWYSSDKHKKFVGKGEVPDTWDIYAASDLGSGNFSATSHPAALVFLGVNPERTRGRVFRAWRGDDVNTTAGDVYEQYRQMCVTIGRDPISKSYDYESADFGIVVERAGDFWYRAEKNIIRGQELVNSLFKYDVLTLDEGDSEIDKMSAELQNVSKDGGKDQRDDLVSCLRYCIMKIPWDWEKIRAESKKDDRPKPEEPEKEPTEREIQRQKMLQPPKAVDFGVEEELEFWQEMFD